MPGYRVTFNISNPRTSGMADSLIEADYALGEFVSGLGEKARMIGHDYFTSAHGVTQFIIRFWADNDADAYEAAEQGLRGVKSPTDSITLARRKRSYEPVPDPSAASVGA